ncbi:hypothetical protein BaRGS_00036570 [Batillaria attramentaria]|uniref:Uncharacterized protein n=1 Tax=Batillaria attramentaria TaxID=370345 RepID=A0ABD0JBK6_9CAEN
MSDILCEPIVSMAQPNQNRNQFWYRKLLRKDIPWHDDAPQPPPSPAHLQLQLQQQHRSNQERERNFRQEWWARRQSNPPLTPDAVESPLIPHEMFAVHAPGPLPNPAGPLHSPGIPSTTIPPSPLLQQHQLPPTPPTLSQEVRHPECLQHLAEDATARWSLEQAERLQQEKLKLDQELEREAMAKAAHIIKFQMDLQEMMRIRQRLRQTITSSNNQAVQQDVAHVANDNDQQRLRQQIASNLLQQNHPHPPSHGVQQHNMPQPIAQTPQSAGMKTLAVPADDRSHMLEKMANLIRAYQQAGIQLNSQQVLNLQQNTEQQVAAYNNLIQSVGNGNMNAGCQQAEQLLKMYSNNASLLNYFPYGTPLPQWNRLDKELALRDGALLRARQAGMHESPFRDRPKAGTPPSRSSHRHHSYSTPRKRRDSAAHDKEANWDEDILQRKQSEQHQHSSTMPKTLRSVSFEDAEEIQRQRFSRSSLGHTIPEGQKHGSCDLGQTRMRSPASSSTPLSTSLQHHERAERKYKHLASPPNVFEKLILTTEKHEIPSDITEDTALEQLPDILEKLKQQSLLEEDSEHAAEEEGETQVKQVLGESETKQQTAGDAEDDIRTSPEAEQKPQFDKPTDQAATNDSDTKLAQQDPLRSIKPLPQRSPREKGRKRGQEHSQETSTQASWEESQESLETSAASSISPQQGPSSEHADESPATKSKRRRNRRKKSHKQLDASLEQPGQQTQPQSSNQPQLHNQATQQQQKPQPRQPVSQQQQRQAQLDHQQRHRQPQDDHEQQAQHQQQEQQPQDRSRQQPQQNQQNGHPPAQRPTEQLQHHHPPQKQQRQQNQRPTSDRSSLERSFSDTGRRWNSRRYDDWNPRRQPYRFRGYQPPTHYQYRFQRTVGNKRDRGRQQSLERDSQAQKKKDDVSGSATQRELTELMKDFSPKSQRASEPNTTQQGRHSDLETGQNLMQVSNEDESCLQKDKKEEAGHEQEHLFTVEEEENKLYTADTSEQTLLQQPHAEDNPLPHESSSDVSQDSRKRGLQDLVSEIRSDFELQSQSDTQGKNSGGPRKQEEIPENEVFHRQISKAGQTEGICVSLSSLSKIACSKITNDTQQTSNQAELGERNPPANTEEGSRMPVTEANGPGHVSKSLSDQFEITCGQNTQHDSATSSDQVRLERITANNEEAQEESDSPTEPQVIPSVSDTEGKQEPLELSRVSQAEPQPIIPSVSDQPPDIQGASNGSTNGALCPVQADRDQMGGSYEARVLQDGACHVGGSSGVEESGGSRDAVLSDTAPVHGQDKLDSQSSRQSDEKLDVRENSSAREVRLLNGMDMSSVIPTPPPSPTRAAVDRAVGAVPLHDKDASVPDEPASVLSLPCDELQRAIAKTMFSRADCASPAPQAEANVSSLASSLQSMLSSETQSDAAGEDLQEERPSAVGISPVDWISHDNELPAAMTESGLKISQGELISQDELPEEATEVSGGVEISQVESISQDETKVGTEVSGAGEISKAESISENDKVLEVATEASEAVRTAQVELISAESELKLVKDESGDYGLSEVGAVLQDGASQNLENGQQLVLRPLIDANNNSLLCANRNLIMVSDTLNHGSGSAAAEKHGSATVVEDAQLSHRVNDSVAASTDDSTHISSSVTPEISTVHECSAGESSTHETESGPDSEKCAEPEATAGEKSADTLDPSSEACSNLGHTVSG